MYVLKMVTFELFLTIKQSLSSNLLIIRLMLMTTTMFEMICLIFLVHFVSGSAYALCDPFYHAYFAPYNQVWVKPLH